MLLPKKLLVQEKGIQQLKLQQEKDLQQDVDVVQLHQEKVLEEQPQGDLLEGEDARTSSFFILINI